MNVLDSVNNTLAPVVRDCLIRQMNQLRKGGILERAAARRMEKDLSLLKAAMEEHEAVVSEIEAKILETGGNSESPMVYRTQQGAAVIIPTNCF